jgi:GrpB-like predicted nucleotidyltransferase (UPF0157 family)
MNATVESSEQCRAARARTSQTLPVEAPAAIEVVPYDPAWPERFLVICDHVWPVVEDVALRIDHVGSTAVAGLAAKPIIDADLVVATPALVAPAIERLASIGFDWIGDLGVNEREAFRYLGLARLPEHHLYLVVENNRPHLDHWLLRDLLRTDADARRRYAHLKYENASLAAGDLKVYTARKAALVAELLTTARKDRGLEPVSYWVPTTAELSPPP